MYSPSYSLTPSPPPLSPDAFAFSLLSSHLSHVATRLPTLTPTTTVNAYNPSSTATTNLITLPHPATPNSPQTRAAFIPSHPIPSFEAFHQTPRSYNLPVVPKPTTMQAGTSGPVQIYKATYSSVPVYEVRPPSALPSRRLSPRFLALLLLADLARSCFITVPMSRCRRHATQVGRMAQRDADSQGCWVRQAATHEGPRT